MNDNGTAKGETIFNAGMRGKKGSPYEGGHRAICFIRWPAGDLGAARAVAYPAHVTDILPTLAELADIGVPEGSTFDGASIAPVLRSADGEGPDRKIVVQYGGRIRPAKYSDSSVIWNNWRLVGETELYDISTDPGQETDVAGDNPEVLAAMKAHYDAYWASIEDSIDPVEPLVVRSSPEVFTDMTSNSWIEVDCDNRTRTAETCGPPRGGVWQIEVEAKGSYAIDLARWPFHMERPLTVAGPAATIGGVLITPGKALPIDSASLSVNGGAAIASQAAPEAAAVRFVVELDEGRNTLQGWFRDASGSDISGAYYGRIRAL